MEGWAELYGMSFLPLFRVRMDPDIRFQHGTGHGFGSFLNVHEGPHGFNSSVPLVPGHVITNEPGFCEFLITSLCPLKSDLRVFD